MIKLVYAILLIQGILWAVDISRRPALTEKEFARSVLSHYIRYYCPRDHICTEAEALRNMKTASPDWTKIYNRGFAILDDENS